MTHIIILSNRLSTLPEARDISHRSYRKMVQNVVLAFIFNSGGIPLAATGLIHPVWAMVAMAVSYRRCPRLMPSTKAC